MRKEKSRWYIVKAIKVGKIAIHKFTIPDAQCIYVSMFIWHFQLRKQLEIINEFNIDLKIWAVWAFMHWFQWLCNSMRQQWFHDKMQSIERLQSHWTGAQYQCSVHSNHMKQCIFLSICYTVCPNVLQSVLRVHSNHMKLYECNALCIYLPLSLKPFCLFW